MRQLLIADQLRDTPKWANNRIARELGVESKTVAAVRSRLEATSEIPKFARLLGADGKERPTTRPPGHHDRVVPEGTQGQEPPCVEAGTPQTEC
ncbi:MAG: hypothetical protein ACREF4_10725 [Gammaproteobacteria bacterium]